MIFEFNEQLTPQNLIDIDDIGNFAIEGVNDDGFFWYMAIRTLLGTCSIVTWGPVIPDLPELVSGYSCDYCEIPYAENKLNKAINFWLNDKKKKITSAQLIDYESALMDMPNIENYLLKPAASPAPEE